MPRTSKAPYVPLGGGESALAHTPALPQAIPAVLEGKHVVAVSDTGSGKSLCFAAPIAHALEGDAPGDGASALVLVPSRELAAQCASLLRRILPAHRSVHVAWGTQRLHGTVSADVIVATPSAITTVRAGAPPRRARRAG